MRALNSRRVLHMYVDSGIGGRGSDDGATEFAKATPGSCLYLQLLYIFLYDLLMNWSLMRTP